MALGTLLATGKRPFWKAVDDFGTKNIINEAVKKVDREKEKRIVDVAAEIEVLFAKRPM